MNPETRALWRLYLLVNQLREAYMDTAGEPAAHSVEIRDPLSLEERTDLEWIASNLLPCARCYSPRNHALHGPAEECEHCKAPEEHHAYEEPQLSDVQE